MSSRTESSDFAHPHDLLVRSILVDEELAADFLRNYLNPELAALLDLKRITCESPGAIDKNLTETLADLRYSTFFKGSRQQLRVFVFLEHQSKPDRFMSLRLLDYVCRAYRQYLSSPKIKERQKTLPYPLAVVLHHGKRPWKKVLPMRELVDTVPGVDNDILRMPVCLVDLATIPPEHLPGNAMVRALLDCLQSASTGRLSERFESITAGLTEFKGDLRLKQWLTALMTYTTRQCALQNGVEMIYRIFNRFYDKTEAEKMTLTFANEMELKGVAKGMAKGKAEGKAESIAVVLAARFGTLPATVSKKIDTIHNPAQLDKLLVLASTCQNLTEFKKELKHTNTR